MAKETVVTVPGLGKVFVPEGSVDSLKEQIKIGSPGLAWYVRTNFKRVPETHVEAKPKAQLQPKPKSKFKPKAQVK